MPEQLNFSKRDRRLLEELTEQIDELNQNLTELNQ